MSSCRLVLAHLLTASAMALLAFPGTAVSHASEGSLKPEAIVSKLFPPVYPPLARQARIAGDVVIQVEVRQDGSVAAAEVISGHPMLKQAALDSAQKTTFECSECGNGVKIYRLIYTFGFREDGSDCDIWGSRLRSKRCLYLWRCGRRQSAPSHLPVVGEAPGHVVVLAANVCVET
jgi:TonB family protein